MYFVYILISKVDKNFYIGFTTELINRLDEHRDGKVESTKERRPLKLCYYEACYNKFDAIRRERYLKSGMGRRFLRNRIKYYLRDNNKGLGQLEVGGFKEVIAGKQT